MTETLTANAETTSDYPTRCPDCNRPVHYLAVFPAGRCLDDHARATANDPLPTAEELAAMWGAS